MIYSRQYIIEIFFRSGSGFGGNLRSAGLMGKAEVPNGS
jgi:hypothetical protein